MINLSSLPKWSQALVHWCWVLICVAIVAMLNYLVTALSNGTFTLPDPQITTPLAGIALGELDTWFVKYEKTVVPQPPATA